MASFTTHNPATGSPLRTWTFWSADQIEDGLARATTAQQHWRSTDFGHRADILHAIAHALTTNGSALAREMTLEMGKPIEEALPTRFQISKTDTTARSYSDIESCRLSTT